MNGSDGRGAGRRGPRPTETAWSERILQAARAQFGERGYQAATVRGIARAAGVDPKLVHYYFGAKEELFDAAITQAIRERGQTPILEHLASRAEGAPDAGVGARSVRAILTALEDERLGPAFLGLVRNLGTHEESRRVLVRFVANQIIGAIAPRLAGPDSEARIALAGSHVLGIVMARYVLRVEPLTSLSVSQIAEAAGPALDRYLFAADLPLSPPAPPRP
ncbi:MAG: TetR family transcriptional regulator [Bifidobacteriaceae bacterium]|jgi:AcrR family transcriptional regulator|nr:TetR family transcriptional regulator [Bifidobacteriaceae bacterium]